MELKSEFARVRVEFDTRGNGPRLMIQDMKTGRAIFLDPLELEGIAWLTHDDLAPFLDPSLGRWADPDPSAVGPFLRQLGVIEEGR